MPQLVTHNFFAKDVFKELNEDIKQKINIPVYEMYSQSFDNYLYIINPFKHKKYKIFDYKGHTKNVNKYFTNIINTIKKDNLKNNDQVLSYLFGSINHYILDSVTHPFIFYKTGEFIYKNKSRKKYIGLHGDMETHIDAFLYLNKCKKMYNKANITNEFIPKIDFNKELENVMNKVMKCTYNENNAGSIYLKSYKNSRLLYKLFINDRYGFKKTIFKIYDKIIPFRDDNYEYHTTFVKNININYLNIEHKKWYYPADSTICKTESFIDLYNIAQEESSKLITLAYNVLFNNTDINIFYKEIGNLSYLTGLDCDKYNKMTKFEF